MSYIDSLNTEEFRSLKEIANWSDYINPILDGIIANPSFVNVYTRWLEVRNKIIRGSTYFTRKYNLPITFTNCYFEGNIIFNNAELFENIVFRDCFCDGDLTVRGNTAFHKNFLCSRFSIKNVSIEEGEYANTQLSFKDSCRLYLNGGNHKETIIGFFEDCDFEYLSLNFANVTGNIKVTGSKTKINKLGLQNTVLNAKVVLEDFSVNSFYFYKYRSDSNTTIMNISGMKAEGNSDFSIVESHLGKTGFSSIDFTSFNYLNILDSHIADCNFVNISWPKVIYGYKGDSLTITPDEKTLIEGIRKLENYHWTMGDDEPEIDDEKRAYYRKIREVYRQIKFALGKQGDIIGEQEFHSKEMIAFKRSLNWETDLGTYAIISFSQCFSNFGQSIKRPLLGLLIGHLILFFILIKSCYFNSLVVNDVQVSYTPAVAFEYFFKLINPLRRNEIPFNGYLEFIDIAMRIWSSYMIFNLIRATRRFIK